MPVTIETPNPFSSARILGENINPKESHRQTAKRGDAAFVMSRGELCDFDFCPAKWLFKFEGREQNDSMRWGDILDCLVLTPDQCGERFVVCPPTYKTEKGEDKLWNWNATFCKEWKAQQNGKAVIKHDDFEELSKAAGKLCKQWAGVLVDAKKQVGVEGSYNDKATGLSITVRGLIDLVPSLDGSLAKSLIDLKTADICINNKAWSRHIDSYGLDVQAALYLDLYTAATGEDRCNFIHIAQEQSPPYHIEPYLLAAEFLELGRMKYVSALKRYCQCLATNTWPGYSARQEFDGLKLVEPEAWMMIGQ